MLARKPSRLCQDLRGQRGDKIMITVKELKGVGVYYIRWLIAKRKRHSEHHGAGKGGGSDHPRRRRCGHYHGQLRRVPYATLERKEKTHRGDHRGGKKMRAGLYRLHQP